MEHFSFISVVINEERIFRRNLSVMGQDLTALNDKELASIIANGKRTKDEAFRTLYNRHAPRLHAYCTKIIGNSQQADDIFQETWVKFYENIKSDNNKGTIIGFLITIARNLCLNYKRDKKQTVEFEDYHKYFEDNNYNSQENQKLIKMAIDMLEFKYKEPLVLRLYDGLNYSEIAKICNLTSENARKRVFRAKQKIRETLEPYYKELFDKT